MNPFFLKKIDGWAGKFLTTLIPSPSKHKQSSTHSSFLFIRPGGIGDAVLLAPAINLLKKHFPEASVDILAERRNAGVFSLVPGIRHTYLYDNPRDLIKALQTPYDVAIDTEQWHRLSVAVARMTGAHVLIGFNTNDRRKLLTHPVPYSHDDYEIESFCRLLQPLGINSQGRGNGSFLIVPAPDMEKAKGLTGPLNHEPYITIFPGASIKERQWGADKFAAVAVKVASSGLNVVVVGGNDDIEQGDRIVSSAKGLNLAGKTTISETAAVISGSQLLLSGDSGVLHLAVGLGIPSVSLFGPGIASKWAPRGDRHKVLKRSLPCSPCTRFGYTPSCKNDVSCLSGITADEVAESTMILLSKKDELAII